MYSTAKSANVSIYSKLALTTDELMGALSCGRKTAVKIGEEAESRISIGKRVLWNVTKIQEYLNSISTN